MSKHPCGRCLPGQGTVPLLSPVRAEQSAGTVTICNLHWVLIVHESSFKGTVGVNSFLEQQAIIMQRT